MAQGPSSFYSPEEYQNFRKSVVILISVWGFLLTAGICVILWYSLSGPKITNVTNNEYKNQSQWQATVVFPNGGIPIDIEHFHHVENKPSVWLSWSERMKQFANKRITGLSARCLWWTSEPIGEDGSERHSIITCFKEKVQKKEK